MSEEKPSIGSSRKPEIKISKINKKKINKKACIRKRKVHDNILMILRHIVDTKCWLHYCNIKTMMKEYERKEKEMYRCAKYLKKNDRLQEKEDNKSAALILFLKQFPRTLPDRNSIRCIYGI